jgi:hypothetical protein
MTRSYRARRMPRRVSVTLAALAAASMLTAARMKDADLEQISDWFAGVYEVTTPVADASNPGTALGERHALVIERVSSPMVGWHVFYAEEHDAGGALVTQELMSFDIAKDKKSIVESSYSFKEPRRWENGLERADIFKSIISEDLIPASGCEIFWIREGHAFVGRSPPQSCRLRARASGEAFQVDLTARLTPSEFVYGDRTFRKRVAGAN